MPPTLFLVADSHSGLQTLADFRIAIGATAASTDTAPSAGDAPLHAAWQTLRRLAEADLERPPLGPASNIEGRSPDQARVGNSDYGIVAAAGERVLRAALVWLLTGESRFLEAAHRQALAIFDEATWPDWRDMAHRDGQIDLRTGQFSRDLGVAFDWLHDGLTAAQREVWVNGFDRRALRPWRRAVTCGDWYLRATNNWMTCIHGGLGILGMALTGRHPEAEALVAQGVEGLASYHEDFGVDGEFNESVGYANAIVLATTFWLAHRYWSGGSENRLAQHPYPQNAYWLLHMTRPPGILVAYGDGGHNRPPASEPLLAIAAATGDPVLHDFARLACRGRDVATTYGLIWRAACLSDAASVGDGAAITGAVPLGRAYDAYGGCIASRSAWRMDQSVVAVHAKANREANHEHNDAGQLTIDGYGAPLIVEVEAIPYPADFFGPNRWHYYCASVAGHNVLQIGDAEQGTDPVARAHYVGRHFDDALGGWWRLDLTAVYPGSLAVHRTVVHLLPGIVAVLDEATLPEPDTITLRWHTASAAVPTADGAFCVCAEPQAAPALAAQILDLGIERQASSSGLKVRSRASYTQENHAYRAPFDHSRIGVPLPQHHEPYVACRARTDACRWLTLFAVLPPGSPAATWRPGAGDSAWTIALPDGIAEVTISPSSLGAHHNGRQLTATWDSRSS